MLPRMRLLALGAAALAAMSLGLAACGGGDSSSNDTTTAANAAPTTAPTAAAPIAVDADPSGALAFTQKTLTASAGTVTFAFTNDSSVPHDFAIEVRNTNDVDRFGVTKVISNGASDDLTVDLIPGEYTYFCTVDGHEQAGMKGTLTVQ
jgi:plastocyanin